MKVFLPVLSLLLLASHSFAAFSLSSIKSIECVDLSTSKSADVYFTTEGSGAEKYARRNTSIPYEYGNKVSPYFSFGTGAMELANRPDRENQKIVLVDSYDRYNQVKLVLLPVGISLNGQNMIRQTKFTGYLTGVIEISSRNSLLKITNRKMGCDLNYVN